MISREFVYEFSNFDDISARENDKKSHAEAFFSREIGVSYIFEEISCQKAGCAESLVDINQPLRLREGGASICSENTLKYKLGK